MSWSEQRRDNRIIRPGFFMENFLGTIGTFAAGVLYAGLKTDTKVQLVVSLIYKNIRAYELTIDCSRLLRILEG